MKSRNPSVQLNLPPALLAKETQHEAVRPKHTQGANAEEIHGSSSSESAAVRATSERSRVTSGEAATASSASTQALAAELFDQALTAAEISTAEVAYLFKVSESLVRRMRSKDAREQVSWWQTLLLPPRYHVAVHRLLNARMGLGRAALARLIGAAEDLALVVEP